MSLFPKKVEYPFKPFWGQPIIYEKKKLCQEISHTGLSCYEGE